MGTYCAHPLHLYAAQPTCIEFVRLMLQQLCQLQGVSRIVHRSKMQRDCTGAPMHITACVHGAESMPNVPKLPWPKLQTWPELVRASECPAPAATLTKCCSFEPLMKRGCGCSTPISPRPVCYRSNRFQTYALSVSEAEIHSQDGATVRQSTAHRLL